MANNTWIRTWDIGTYQQAANLGKPADLGPELQCLLKVKQDLS